MKNPWGPPGGPPPSDDDWDEPYRPPRHSVPPAPAASEGDDALRRPRTFSVSRPMPSQPPPAPPRMDSEPPSTNFAGEDFLFHLYRGSELLQDNCISEAKEELERALAMRPRDVEGQGLLGVVYFRLGLYPRAIEIYQELIQAFPEEVTPRVNLALCHVKTGQHHQARELLEDVIRRLPDHKRAWGYLGLVFERLGDLAKALAAYQRAGQDHMARRVEQRLEGGVPREIVTSARPEELRDVVMDAIQELEDSTHAFTRADTDAGVAPSRTGRWKALEPGRDEASPRSRRAESALRLGADLPPVVDSIPPPPSLPPMPAAGTAAPRPLELAALASIPLPTAAISALSNELVLVRVEGGMLVRLASVRALMPEGGPFSHSPAYRRARGQPLSERLGGASGQLGLLEGRGAVVLAAREGQRLVPLLLDEDQIYVREALLVGFEGSLRYESGRLPSGEGAYHACVQLSGKGALVLECRGRLRSIPISSGRGAVVESGRVLAWTGRLLPQAASPEDGPGSAQGFVVFAGEGSIFVELE